ncbi:MAG: potassium channel family protein [Muribaculaceae bacterium]|nr:potassium channel family protein [Muribaculaceae bacterium]
MKDTLSNETRHFFHVVSNVRPIAWIALYIVLMPVFALIYWGLPADQFRIPDGAGTDFGSWLYYSIVTITTLGFGDYTPAHGWAQAVTAIEVMCGLVTLGFFLNAVGSMKSEIDVESEIEKQRRLHEAAERDKLIKSTPTILHVLNRFIDAAASCTPSSSQEEREQLLKSAARISLCLDTLQSRIDLTQWPQLLESCFTLVAEYQLYSSTDSTTISNTEAFTSFIDTSSKLASTIETELTNISRNNDQ